VKDEITKERLPKVYTPIQHIPIAEVFRVDGIIYLRFKKSKENVQESVPLDSLLVAVSNLAQESLISGAGNAAMDRACVKMIVKQEERLKKEIEHYGNLKSKLYSDMVDGLISKDEFKELNERFSKSREVVEETLKGVVERKNMILNDQIRFLPWVENLKKYRDITELTRSVVISTIDNVVIHDDKMVEIHFQFEDELNELLEVSMEREEA